MTISRIEIEQGLDELVSYEEGLRFQSLAVILARQRWPELIASEWKWDHGLDAHSPSGCQGLATSITPGLSKIRRDAERARGSYPKLRELIFYTPKPVSNHSALNWAEEIRKELNLELIVVSREDLITSLMEPANAPLCQSHLGIAIPIPEAARDKLADVFSGCGETISNWLRQYRLDGQSLINLDLIRITDQERAAVDSAALTDELRHGRRVVLEGPPGSGKTTTLLQLARASVDASHFCLVIDLPAWIESGQDLFTFQALSPAFRSRRITATDLDSLAASQPLMIFLNGWNEIGEPHSAAAGRQLRKLDREYPGAGILLATRAHTLAPPLRGSLHVAIQPLRSAQRRAYLSEILGDRAGELAAQIADRPALDTLTRTPLILSEVVKLFGAGEAIPEARVDILRAMAVRIEQSDEHHVALATPPIAGFASAYLEALAVEMTKQGKVDLADNAARAAIATTAAALRDAGQLSSQPEPGSVLSALCGHHVLQRLDHPAPTFRFQHQQFQEGYAASHLLAVLRSLLDSPDSSGVTFQRTYLNRPVWQEPLLMVAEALSVGSSAIAPTSAAVDLGEQLVRLSIPVDPVFAADLARQAGGDVWHRVGPELRAHLLRWYDCGDRHHRRCALTAMLASGSDDFAAIVVPLLTSPDDQVRLSVYRNEVLHPSSLGTNWREVVATWDAGQRASFVGEVLARPAYAAVAEDFAINDPSPEVRTAAVHALQQSRAHDSLTRVLETLDGPGLLDATSQGRQTEDLPEAAKRRLVVALRALVEETDEAKGRIHLLHRLVRLGDSEAPDRLKGALDSLADAEFRGMDEWNLQGVVNSVRTIDPRWTDAWLTQRLVSGRLWPDRWMSSVDTVPPTLVAQLVEEVCRQELDQRRLRGAIELLSRWADAEMARRLWRRLVEVQPRSPVDGEGPHEPLRAALRWQLQEALRSLPTSLRVSSALSVLWTPPDPEQVSALVEVFGRVAENEDFRSDLAADLAQSLRETLVALVPFALGEDDFGGGLKASLALAISRIGVPEDAVAIRRLIDADIDRCRRGLELRRQGVRDDQANGAVMKWSRSHVEALRSLGAEAAEAHLLELLREPEYEADAARALAGLVIQSCRPQAGLRNSHRVPGSDPPTVIDERRRAQYARAVRERIDGLMSPPDGGTSPPQQIKALACTLSWLDGQEALDLVLRVMALPAEWDGSSRADALEQLLRVHRHLPTEATFAVLSPTMEHVRSGRFRDQQSDYLLTRCLALVALVDDQARGVARIREVLTTARLPGYHIRDLVHPLARNGSEQALSMLIELANSAGGEFESFRREWVTAVGMMALPRARDAFLACVDPRIDPIVPRLAKCPQEVGEQVARFAQSEPGVLAQIREACKLDLTPAHREALAHTVALMADEDTVAEALELIWDDSTPPVPFQLIQAIENSAFDREPLGVSSSGYTLVPRADRAVRARLFAMVVEDPNRHRTAFSLLGQIEAWRLDSGRPVDEPRHPNIDSGRPWPPLDLVDWKDEAWT